MKSTADLVAKAKQEIENLTPAQVKAELENGVTLIDLRESEELKEHGKITGSVHAPRGMIEFYADPAQPYHKPAFDRDKRLVLHCGSGGRSALTVKTLKELGYTDIAHLDGGFKAWKEAGFETEEV